MNRSRGVVVFDNGRSIAATRLSPPFAVLNQLCLCLMNPNPYSLSTSTNHDRYFTDDITLMPIGSIWRSMRGQPLFPRTLAFAYFIGRKTLRKRMPANYGTRYPPSLTETPKAELPDDAVQAIAILDDDCHAAGMEHVGYYLPSWIGGKRGVLSISIDQCGMVWCSVTWLQIRVGDCRNSRVVFACHSETRDGTELHTAAETSDDWIPKLIPPNVQIDRISSDSTVSCIIDRHNTRVADRTDIVTFDKSSLKSHIEQRSLEQLDFMVSNGFYAELTPDEINRLRRTM